jgi:hypothetical protein
MTYSSCPTAVVNAPVEIVWRLMTEPARWGEFFDVRITEVDPPGPAIVGQKFYGESGPPVLRLRLTFEYIKIDPVRHALELNVQLPFGVFVREELDCIPLSITQCRFNYHCNFSFPVGWRGVILRLIMSRKLDTGPIDSLSRLKLAAEQLYERSRG